MTDQPFRNTTTQKERREVLRDTMQYRTAADMGLENTGRFSKPFAVTGSEPTTQYPKLPANSPFANDPVGLEEPIDASDCSEAFGVALGEPFEQSLGDQQQQPIGAICNAVGAEGESASNDPPALSPASLGEVVAPAKLASSPSANAAVETPPRPPSNYETVEPTLRRMMRKPE